MRVHENVVFGGYKIKLSLMNDVSRLRIHYRGYLTIAQKKGGRFLALRVRFEGLFGWMFRTLQQLQFCS